MSFQNTSNLQDSAQSPAFAKSFGSTAYGWDVEKIRPSEKIRKQAYYTTSKNLFLTQKDTKRRLKQNLLQSTITPFLADFAPYNSELYENTNVRVDEGNN